jgi:hypothetical protein
MGCCTGAGAAAGGSSGAASRGLAAGRRSAAAPGSGAGAPPSAAALPFQADVRAVVDYLKAQLGATWLQASAPRLQQNSVLVSPPRAQRPWVERDRMMAANRGRDFEQWVRSHWILK